MKNQLTNCKACGKELAKGVKKCINCGKDQRNFFMKHKILTGFLALLIIGAIGSGGGNNTNSSSIKSDNNESQEMAQKTNSESTEKVAAKEKIKEDIPTEYKSALRKAKVYSDTMAMSKAGLYDQLTSEYGEKFSQEAAQYAIDNIDANWKENALKKAKTYQGSMAMSPSAIYDQLKSEHGEKFTEEEAQYAVDNLE
ncbi:Ltp family lipoprotein [Paraclostridium tenue]|uniref:Putative host cell surface-exposed lipoprotein Ltp-like HTH region domain-containing protein n=1 Tax=Paraclostridium tenue TaxID=1737 RepID=A0ABP3XDI9_9FIRM